MSGKQRMVIVGGGFGGLNAARALRREPVEITLIDRRNFHLFQPLLYQVATGGLSPANIAAPLRAILEAHDNVNVLLAEVTHIDTARREVILREETIPYDVLIVATGSSHHYFGHPEWERWAPSLKTIEDATEVRRRVLSAFEAAEREPDLALCAAWLTFVIVGGGPTGVELAGAVAELARFTLRRNFRKIDPAVARIILVEGADRVLPAYAAPLSAKAARGLEQLGVTLHTAAMVTNIEERAVTVRIADAEHRIEARTVLWAAGVAASPLGKILAEGTGATLDHVGRLIVEPDLSLPGHPEIYVLGDLANFSHQTGTPLPGLAPVAMQQGHYVAKLLKLRRMGKSFRAFRYFDRGSMATIGRGKAVADVRGIRFSGFLAWLSWLFIHLMFIIQFQSRILILIQWAWNYTTRNAPARLITGRDPFIVRPRVEEATSKTSPSSPDPGAN